MAKIYAGIGSRETPLEVIKAMQTVAAALAKKHWILRSGGADGADTAFEIGCDSVGGNKEIYIPWKGFNKSTSELYRPHVGAELIAKLTHPNWDACSDGAKKLHSRNVLQMLGLHLNHPVAFVICYTKNGSGAGGTGQALRIAAHLGIPVVDFGAVSLDQAEVLAEQIICEAGQI